MASPFLTAPSPIKESMTRPSMAELKMLFGFVLLVCISTLAGFIALGRVHQDSSYGLPEILGGLLALAGGFSNWAFGESRTSQTSNGSKNGKDV